MKPKTKQTVQPNLTKKVYQPPKTILPEHQEFMSKIGEQLQSLQKTNSISMYELAIKLGVSRNALNSMLKGKTYFNLYKFLQVLAYFKVNPTDFFKNL